MATGRNSEISNPLEHPSYRYFLYDQVESILTILPSAEVTPDMTSLLNLCTGNNLTI